MPREGLLDQHQWGWRTLPRMRQQPTSLSKHLMQGTTQPTLVLPSSRQKHSEGHLPGLCYSCVVYLDVAISIRKRTKTQAAKLLHLHAKWGIMTVCTVWCVKQGGTGTT